MKKVGIITMIGNNFGNRLQNFALQEYLKKLKVQPETIYNNVYEIPKQKNTILSIPKKIYIKLKNIFLNKKYKKVNNERDNLFNNFNNKYMQFSKERVFEEYNLKKLYNKYDKFIVGSDQVWNPYAYRNKDIDFLSFSTKDKNSSYAVSFGVEKLNEQFEAIYKEGLKNFNYISVREDKGKEIVKKITKREDIEVLVDPTMLLTQEEWTKIEKRPSQLKDKKYILNYFLGEISKERKKEIEKVAKENDCVIINILDKNDPFYVSGPSEFLYLERNAFLICTDSFHSCVFAILFNRPFIVFNREDKSVNMNSRIETLLSKFKLENRYYKGKIDKELLKADYMEAYKILKEERKKSLTFLKKALDIEEI